MKTRTSPRTITLAMLIALFFQAAPQARGLEIADGIGGAAIIANNEPEQSR